MTTRAPPRSPVGWRSQRPGRVLVVTDTNERKNKPRALNVALPYCRGDVVGVFDAEDQVHPTLLEHVDHAFRSTGADVVQGGVQLINFHSSWYSLHNCLEYFFWFRSRLHLHARRGLHPARRQHRLRPHRGAARRANGWDGTCLAEDCDLGVRLSSRGAKVVVAYDSAMVTREETPDSLLGLLKQRTRWNQGFLQVYRKGEWRRLRTFSQRLLARYTLTGPFVQAFSGVVAPDRHRDRSVRRCFRAHRAADLPAGSAHGGERRVPGRRAARFRQAVRRAYSPVGTMSALSSGAFPYMLVLTAAALRAAWREYTGRRNWELTRHVGAHLIGRRPRSPVKGRSSDRPRRVGHRH